ncbi:MAG: hypothetical protein Q4G50_08705 [Corynebacterium sp.]|uniref:type IV toxin-antitoxin system AbiEi family antitoxin domain-containing protein n=1 Tax=Corynebacterium sp. TaxID=1720 RepID=UPI0026DEF8AE|nr:hypothetical protein [Corynebacterium sp.]MDO5670069.1 hypothetical protein [Corynebacterium sp.]
MNQVGGPVISVEGMTAAQRRRLYREWKQGIYVRIERGLFMLREEYEDLEPDEEVELRIVAAAHVAGKSVVVGRSAALLWGFPIVDSPLAVTRRPVEVAAERARTRNTAKVIHRPLAGHHVTAIEEKATEFGTVRVTDALTTALDLARWGNVQEAVRALDYGLQEELFTPTDIRTRVAEITGVHGIAKIRQAALLASLGSESPRETDLKLLFHELGVGVPWQQADISSRSGLWIGRVDFFFPELCLVIEYDGREKYVLDAANPDATRAKEHRQGEEYRINGLTTLYICDETLRNGTAARLISEHIEQLRGVAVPYPDHLWTGLCLAWEC